MFSSMGRILNLVLKSDFEQSLLEMSTSICILVLRKEGILGI